MSFAPPHLYRNRGVLDGHDPKLIERALAIAAPTQQHGLPPVLTLGHLAQLTGAPYQYLRDIVSRKIVDYRVFEIRKRRGGSREICAPRSYLRQVQRWIAKHLLNNMRPHWRSFAYAPGSSIVACAREHCGARWLVKIDIMNFFQSITERRAYLVLRKVGYQPLVAFEISRICTIGSGPTNPIRKGVDSMPYMIRQQGYLPQGAPTSPMFANLACYDLDQTLLELSEANGVVYTRYSDDLTFSSSERSFNRSNAKKFVHRVYAAIAAFGLSHRATKTTIATPGGRRIVLGMAVDSDRPRLSKEARRRLANHVRCVEKFGFSQHAVVRNFESIWGLYNHLSGAIAAAKAVDADFARRLRTKLRDAAKRDIPGFTE